MIFSPFAFQNSVVSAPAPPAPSIPSGYTFYYDINNSTTYPGTGTTLYDLSANGYNATLSNGPVYNSGTPDYFAFDGTNDFGNVGNSGSFGTSTGNFTFGGWIRFSTLNVFHNIITRGRDNNGAGWSFFCGVHNTNKPHVAMITTSPSTVQTDLNGATTLTNNTWYNIVVTWENAVSLKVYLNGVLDGTFNTTRSSLRSSTIYWDIGRINNSYFAQDLSEIIVYHRLLNGTEITELFDATKSIYGY